MYCQLYLLLVQLPSVVPCIDFLCKNFPLCQANNRPQRDSNPQSSDSKSDALSVRQCGHLSFRFFLLLVQLLNVIPCIDFLCKNFSLCQTKCRPQRYSNPQSSDSKSTLYLLGHAALCHVNCICYLFSCQVLSFILTSFVRTFLVSNKKSTTEGFDHPIF